MEKNIGIVLKTCSKKNRIIFILDQKIGKIKCIPNCDNIITGSIIQYLFKNKKTPYLIESIELLHVPFEIANNDIYFLHHILELCDLLIPFENCSQEIFSLIIFLYKNEMLTKNKNKKQLFTFKLLTLFGLHPEDARFHTPYFHNLYTESIDNIMAKNLNLEIENEIVDWLQNCINSQQEFHKFKTINFLYKN